MPINTPSKVLWIEDECDVIGHITLTLAESDQFFLEIAATYEDAAQLLDWNTYSVVIVDLDIPLGDVRRSKLGNDPNLSLPGLALLSRIACGDFSNIGIAQCAVLTVDCTLATLAQLEELGVRTIRLKSSLMNSDYLLQLCREVLRLQ